MNAVDFSRIVKHKGDGAVQENVAINILGNVISEMGDGPEVTIEVEIETTGANAEKPQMCHTFNDTIST